MFKRKQPPMGEQIPYALYETLQKGAPRRSRWLLEFLIGAMIVLVIAVGSAWVFKNVHDAKTPSRTQGPSVTQSPQTTTQTDQPTNQPAATSASGANNGAAVTQPAN